jgi:hypothetical protein
MKPNLISLVWHLPGARSFLYRTGQALQDGVSQLCLFVNSSDVENFQDQLLQHLEQEQFVKVRMIDLRHNEGSSPFEILQRVLLRENNYQYLEKMVSDPNLPAVTIVSHFEDRSAKEVEHWVQSFARWAEACRSSGSLSSLALLMCVEHIEEILLPTTDVRLAYSIWPGAPSALDVRMLCRYISSEIDSEAQWREFIIASLSGNDLELAECLWEYACSPFEVILSVLENYAFNRNWSSDEILKKLEHWHPIPAGCILNPKPNSNGFKLICRGLTVYTPEFGEEIHSAALMLLGRQTEILHRVWRAQAALILPIIDDIRRRICDYFTFRYGSQWAIIDNELLDTPIDLGKLKYYFDLLPESSWEKKQWGQGIYQVWFTRNELAHYRPVSFYSFSEIWRLNVTIHSMLHRLI